MLGGRAIRRQRAARALAQEDRVEDQRRGFVGPEAALPFSAVDLQVAAVEGVVRGATGGVRLLQPRLLKLASRYPVLT